MAIVKRSIFTGWKRKGMYVIRNKTTKMIGIAPRLDQALKAAAGISNDAQRFDHRLQAVDRQTCA